ncbi:serine hydrolase [Sulfitobacter sp. 1151]|uniref:Serine hydrolase n=2 Tax=Parasulfitobacter algicola TaxID=2614809 RepID=A0ABX2ISE0_9RHOB|nr:serine hydrolase [Sulfitobacter algicola]
MAAHVLTAETSQNSLNIGKRIDLAYQSGVLQDLHAVLVLSGNETVTERYFSGTDENWGRPLGKVTFGPTTLHDLRSVSKSITSLLYGIALDQGKVPAPDTPLLTAFSQYSDLTNDPKRASWTVSHALNMMLGTDWNETIPYDNPANSEIAMERAPDRYRFILSRPIIADPGTRWNYNGGCTALIAYLIEQGTGQSLDEFTKQHLFSPLGITQFEWNRGDDGVISAASGLRMTAPDLARIGQMILANGRWNDRQVVPEQWIKACQTPQATLPSGMRYANQWYLSRQPAVAPDTARHSMMSAHGNGGQRLMIFPDLDLVSVMYSGRYNQGDDWINPTLILWRIILEDVNQQR